MSGSVFKTVKELSQLIQGKKASSEEIVKEHIDRIRLHNNRVNAVVTLDEEAALAMAKKADTELAKKTCRGSLHGIPITVKDSIATADIRTTSGYSPLKNYIPETDAPAVAKLKDAGAIVIGKTNTSTLTFDIQTNNDIFGRTNNPWNLEYTSGGSSGGSATCVAYGMSPADIGSDTTGSIRIPAHFCGVYGLKPTLTSVPSNGIMPGISFNTGNFRVLNPTTIGPIARSADDLKIIFRVMAGLDQPNRKIPPEYTLKNHQIKLKDIRFAWIPSFPGIKTAGEISAAIYKLAYELMKAGCYVEQGMPDIDFGGYADFYEKFDNSFFAPSKIVEYKNKLNHFYSKYDVLLCPPCFTTAFRHCEPGSPIYSEGIPVNYDYLDYETAFFSFTGQPAVVMPYGLSSEGLPVGIQLVCNAWQDEKLLAIASEIEPLTGGFRKPSGF